MGNRLETQPAMDLSRFDEDFKQAGVPEQPLAEEVPDGEYRTVIEEVRLVATISTGNPMLTWTLRIVAPDAADRVLRKNRVITDKTLSWVKEDLQKCGVVLQRFSDLPKHLDEMVGVEIPVVKRTKDGKSGVWFQWRDRKKPPAPDEPLPF